MTLLALRDGLARAFRHWRVGALLLFANLLAAAILAVPLGAALAADLHERPAGARMMYAFDYPWWSEWKDTRAGWATSFTPDILGAGFAVKTADLLLKGEIPAGLFRRPGEPRSVHALLAAAGAAYLVLHVFLSGGALAALRQGRREWTLRGFLHAGGFYFGRFLRITGLGLLAAALLFLAYWPLAGWMDERAAESVSERAAMAWLLGRHLLLLLALLALHVVTSYARAVVVVEERTSAVLAFVSALGLFLGSPLRSLGVALGLLSLGLLAVAGWHGFELAWSTTGYETQAVTLVAMQAFMLVRILLRLSLWAAVLSLHERSAQAA